MSQLLKLENVIKNYGKRTILDISDLQLEEGKIYGIVGKNGAGKTTLFRLLCGLTFPTNGYIRYEDPSIKKGVIIEYPSIEYQMTGAQNLQWAKKLYGTGECMDVTSLLRLVDLEEYKNEKVKKYSLGMKQRLGIAMCLVCNPRLLILDEPMNGLDPQGIVEFRKILKAINAQGTTILISSHILDELYKLATDYIFIKNGKIVKEISQNELEKMETGEYELMTSNNEDAIKIITNLSCNISEKKEKIIFMAKKETILHISKALAEKEIYILGLKENKFDIEEYYIKILGE